MREEYSAVKRAASPIHAEPTMLYKRLSARLHLRYGSEMNVAHRSRNYLVLLLLQSAASCISLGKKFSCTTVRCRL
jgi:hypothetical protein